MREVGLSRFLDPTAEELRHQWYSVLARNDVPPGTRQVDFIPSEVILSLCASFLVDHQKFGGKKRSLKAGTPIPELARLYRRPATSFIAKMANLDGTRPHGGKFEIEVAARLQSDSDQLRAIYLEILFAARNVGIDELKLPDFLGLENGAEFWLVGQDALREIDIESAVELQVDEWTSRRPDISTEITQRLMTSTARVGQHRFATDVLRNHGNVCVFCGMSGSVSGRRRPRLLTASHIKPWRVSSGKERLDPRNGLAACPTHDIAFDTGLITVDENLGIRRAPEIEADLAAKSGSFEYAFGRPPLYQELVLPATARRPDISYLRFHQSEVYIGKT